MLFIRNNPQRIDEQFDLVQGGTKLWPICDGLGSVYAWVDRSGAVQDTYSYDVYGSRTQASGHDNIAWGFTGREHDADTGLIQDRPRYLSAQTANFLQPDPIGMRAGPNFYAYANLSPTNFRDPHGTFAEIGFADAIGQLAGQILQNAGAEYINQSACAGDDDDLRASMFDYGFALAAMGIAITMLTGGPGEEPQIPWLSWEQWPKVEEEGVEYAQVGERLWTQHAIERTYPSGLGAAASGTAGRSVAPAFAEYVIQNGARETQIVNGVERTLHTLGDVSVVTEDAERIVVTVLIHH